MNASRDNSRVCALPCFLDTALVGSGVVAENFDLLTVDNNDIDIGSRSQIIENTSLNCILHQCDGVLTLCKVRRKTRSVSKYMRLFLKWV